MGVATSYATNNLIFRDIYENSQRNFSMGCLIQATIKLRTFAAEKCNK